jgi:subtilisin family serine protease
MYSVQNEAPARARRRASPSDELRIAVTFKRPADNIGPTKMAARMSAASVSSFKPEAIQMDRAIYELHKQGFTLTRRGQLTLSMRGSKEQFEKVFGTKLSTFRLQRSQNADAHAFYYPPPGAPWHPDPGLMELIDDAYIQWPHIYMSKKKPKASTPANPKAGAVSATPPHVNYFHLEMPTDVPSLLNATQVHRAGTTGKGIRVAMVDSGFAHSHPFFAANGFQSTVDLAPGVKSSATDANGHGTGESTNIFAVAPGATFIGIKLDNDDPDQQGASILEGFQQALQHKPHIISCSLGYDLVQADPATGKRLSNQHLTTLPNNLVALEAEIHAAVAAGTVVVFSAGNGHVSFPGMMPDVISAGGVFVDAAGKMQASDYASAFESRIYSGRHVPDFCGLVGLGPHADYIMLPIPSKCEIDKDNSQHDGTTSSDGWGVFSGTSAAAPQLAGVCALLLEKNPGLTPSDIKSILRRTCRDVLTGHANPASNNDAPALQAGPGDDGATGAGLVDVFAAFQQA